MRLHDATQDVPCDSTGADVIDALYVGLPAWGGLLFRVDNCVAPEGGEGP